MPISIAEVKSSRLSDDKKEVVIAGKGKYVGELELFVADLGFSPAGAMRAATQVNARFMTEGRTELLVPMYLYLLLWFFIYCYPIARATVALERRFQVH